jgi:hypothetical protein
VARIPHDRHAAAPELAQDRGTALEYVVQLDNEIGHGRQAHGRRCLDGSKSPCQLSVQTNHPRLEPRRRTELTLSIGSRFGPYEILAALGAGGMGLKP